MIRESIDWTYTKDEIVEGFNEDVHWHDAIPFDDLAEVLPRYDVGLILYKGHIPNYVQCAEQVLGVFS